MEIALRVEYDELQTIFVGVYFESKLSYLFDLRIFIFIFGWWNG